jgi:restriction endonuclease Mrr
MARSKNDGLFGPILGCCFLLLMIVVWISEGFKIPFWVGLVSAAAVMVCIPFLLIVCLTVTERIGNREARRKKLEHEAWLQTPQGIARQEEEREKLRNRKEEEDRRRKEVEESAARAEWRLYYELKTLDEVSRMTGREFEEFLARLFQRLGYSDITLTPSNDQGGDIICLSPIGARVVIQAKRWKGRVGNDAVQEVLGAMLYYDCPEGMVITNSTFTDAARELAEKHSASHSMINDGLSNKSRSSFPLKCQNSGGRSIRMS